jgi:hypothetical protein
MSRCLRLGAGFALALVAPAGATAAEYRVSYDALIVPSTRSAQVRVSVAQSSGELRRLRFRIDPERHRAFEGAAGVVVEHDQVEWIVPAQGGVLQYEFGIDHLRDAAHYDARCAADWAIFRAGDLFPPAAAVTKVGAVSKADLQIRGPEGWSVVTRWAPTKGRIPLEAGGRRFVRPTGWVTAGRRLGVVREKVAGVRVTVAGPAGQGLRRLDILALLRWTLPELDEILGGLPERLLVVGAGDPMWRGGLSGPGSFFVHADRPLITPDVTSPILHEVLHSTLRVRAATGDDWIVEGLAEYYALDLLVRSKTIGRSRHDRALADLARKGRRASSLTTDSASGPVTDRAVGFLRQLDAEIREASKGARSLDDVVRAIQSESSGEVSRALLRTESERAAGRSLGGLFERNGL